MAESSAVHCFQMKRRHPHPTSTIAPEVRGSLKSGFRELMVPTEVSHKLPSWAHSFRGHTPTPPSLTLLPPNQDCLSTVRVGTGQWQCVHLRAHKYALMTNWQDGLVHKRTQRKGYKSLMKYCSEVCVFFSWIVSELSPFQPHSWPTPRWDGSSGGSSTQAVLCPTVCLFHPHLAVLDQKLRTTPKGEVRSGGEFFISDKGSRGRDTVIYSLLAFRYCLGLALCSTHLLPLCNPGSANTLFSWFWPAKRIFQEQAAARGGRDAKMIFKHWGNSYSSFRYQLKLCFSSYNRLNL